MIIFRPCNDVPLLYAPFLCITPLPLPKFIRVLSMSLTWLCRLDQRWNHWLLRCVYQQRPEVWSDREIDAGERARASTDGVKRRQTTPNGGPNSELNGGGAWRSRDPSRNQPSPVDELKLWPATIPLLILPPLPHPLPYNDSFSGYLIRTAPSSPLVGLTGLVCTFTRLPEGFFLHPFQVILFNSWITELP